jgi:membrane protease YdiL (CAAX protease family)
MTGLAPFYATLVRRHAVMCAALACVAIFVLAASTVRGHAGQAVGYLAAVGLGVVSIDGVCGWGQARARPIPVRDPRLESLMLMMCWVIAIAWLTGRFVFNYRPASAPLRLAWVVIGLGCIFAVIPALFLLARRYWPADLGLRFTGVLVALPVLAIFAAITFAFSPRSLTWPEIVREAGSPLGIVVMALSAAVPEEFFRVVWQTRIGAWAGSRAAGWLVATVVWAMLHGPKDFSESHSLVAAAIDVLDIVPLGLLWGYLTHRTGSFLPSLLLHGMNVWGLQNL